MVISSSLVYFSMPPRWLLHNRKQAPVSQNSWYIYALTVLCTFHFIYFLKGFTECEEELHWRSKIGCSYVGRQYLLASHREGSLFTFFDDKNFDIFRSLILFVVSHSFSVLTKNPWRARQAKQQGSCLGSWW